VRRRERLGSLHCIPVSLTRGCSPRAADAWASVNALDGFVYGTPLLWAADGWRGGHSEDTGDFKVDHLGVARQLIAAGSPLEWQAPENAPHPEAGQEQLLELCRAAR
jgi:hypothetical protein